MTNSNQTIDQIEFKTKLLEQAFLIEMILNKFAYETQSLIAIINAALDGRVHTNVLSSQQLLRELREVKMIIPAGNSLPIEIKAETLTELLSVVELSVFVQDNHLVYVIKIPLVSNTEYNVYRPIPLPIQYDFESIILINPESDFIAISSDSENFLYLESEQRDNYIKLTNNRICKETLSIQHRSKSTSCELSLLTNHRTSIENCNIKLVKVNSQIWHKLSQTNSWLYYTNSEVVLISCSDPQTSQKVEISGVGRLTIASSCKIHTDHSIFLPNNKANRNIQLDIIPLNSKINVTRLTESLKNLIPQQIININGINNLNYLANKAMELSKLSRVSHEPIFIVKIEFYVALIYVFFCILIVVIIILSIRISKRPTKMYNPEIPECNLEDKGTNTEN